MSNGFRFLALLFLSLIGISLYSKLLIKQTTDINSMRQDMYYSKSYIYSDGERNNFLDVKTDKYTYNESHLLFMPLVDVRYETGNVTIPVTSYIILNPNKIAYKITKDSKLDETNMSSASLLSSTENYIKYNINRNSIYNSYDLVQSINNQIVAGEYNISVDGSNTSAKGQTYFNTEGGVIR